MQDLAKKLDEIMEAYLSDRYKTQYPFLDYFQRLDSSEIVLRSQLNAMLEDAVLLGSNRITYASPESDVRLLPESLEITWKTMRSGIMERIAPPVVAHLVKSWGVRNPLSEVKVHGFRNDDDRELPVYRLRHCITGDFTLHGNTYTIYAGTWYKVNNTNLARLEQRLAQICVLSPDEFNTGPWTSEHKNEEEYNIYLAKQCGGIHMEKSKFRMGGPHQQIEVCDVLTKDKQLVCVKHAESSSVLSHLFAQGWVTAWLLVKDFEGYRQKVCKYLGIDGSEDSFDRREWSVVFCIATEKPGPLHSSLFFFSKVMLDNIASKLREVLNIRPALLRIDYIKKDSHIPEQLMLDFELPNHQFSQSRETRHNRRVSPSTPVSDSLF